MGIRKEMCELVRICKNNSKELKSKSALIHVSMTYQSSFRSGNIASLVSAFTVLLGDVRICEKIIEDLVVLWKLALRIF